MKPKPFRRHLRQESTSAEKAMWESLRNRKFNNLKFRRQYTIGDFTVDFYNEELKLIIEVDGSVHNNLGQANYDDDREEALKQMGYHIFRADNDAVLFYIDTVLEDLSVFIRGIK